MNITEGGLMPTCGVVQISSTHVALTVELPWWGIELLSTIAPDAALYHPVSLSQPETSAGLTVKPGGASSGWPGPALGGLGCVDFALHVFRVLVRVRRTMNVQNDSCTLEDLAHTGTGLRL